MLFVALFQCIILPFQDSFPVTKCSMKYNNASATILTPPINTLNSVCFDVFCLYRVSLVPRGKSRIYLFSSKSGLRSKYCPPLHSLQPSRGRFITYCKCILLFLNQKYQNIPWSIRQHRVTSICKHFYSYVYEKNIYKINSNIDQCFKLRWWYILDYRNTPFLYAIDIRILMYQHVFSWECNTTLSYFIWKVVIFDRKLQVRVTKVKFLHFSHVHDLKGTSFKGKKYIHQIYYAKHL